MFRFIVGMSFVVCLSSVAGAGPNRYSVRVDVEVLRQQEQVAAAARAFRSTVYTRYRTDRQTFDRYWAAGEQTWQAWGRADYPVSHADAVIAWFDSAAATASGSRFGGLPPTPQLPNVDADPTPFRSIATPSGSLQSPAQPAGEVVFPTTPTLSRQAAEAPSHTHGRNDGATTTPQFLTNPTLIDPAAETNPFEADDAEANPFEADSAEAAPESRNWMQQWKRTLFSPVTTRSRSIGKPLPTPETLTLQTPTLQPASGSPQRKAYQEPTLCTEYPALARGIGKAKEGLSKAEREKLSRELKRLGK